MDSIRGSEHAVSKSLSFKKAIKSQINKINDCKNNETSTQ